MTVEPPKTEQQYLDFYQKLRVKIRAHMEKRRKRATPDKPTAHERLVEHMALVPDFFHLAVRLLFDPATPAGKKAILAAMAAYIISPLDLIPDILPGGYIDDIVLLAIELNRVLADASDDLKAAARRHWAGEGDVFETLAAVTRASEAAMTFLPRKFMSMIHSILGGASRPE